MTLYERLDRVTRGDRGFSLIEVLVAIVILSIISAASLNFALRANVTSAYQQHNQIAVTLANEAMESVAATNLNALYSGRGQNAVDTAFTANSAVDGVSATYRAWDTTAATNSNGTIPITNGTAPDRLSGTDYTTVILIGACFRPQSSLVGTNCGVITGKATAALARAVPGYVEEIRVIAIVRWDADDECPSGCNYQTSTIIDPGSDLEWIG